jgi:hypothetical protein
MSGLGCSQGRLLQCTLVAIGPQRRLPQCSDMVAIEGIVLQNPTAFCSWAGFKHWSACGVLH